MAISLQNESNNHHRTNEQDGTAPDFEKPGSLTPGVIAQPTYSSTPPSTGHDNEQHCAKGIPNLRYQGAHTAPDGNKPGRSGPSHFANIKKA